MAYNLETILAEKYESIIKRNISSTRMRDFYDVYILSKIKGHKLDFKVLKEAIKKTALKRNSLDYIKSYKELIEEMKHDSYLHELWEAYLSENQYLGDLEFNKTIEAIQIIGDRTKI